MPPLSGLAADDSPLPLRIRIGRQSRVNTAPVGYHPVGMKPFTRLRPPLLMSMTVTVFVSAFATSSIRPSGDTATELGVEVGGASGKRLVEICSMASPENVSSTHTAELLPHATNNRLPSTESAIAFGCSPVGMS